VRGRGFLARREEAAEGQFFSPIKVKKAETKENGVFGAGSEGFLGLGARGFWREMSGRIAAELGRTGARGESGEFERKFGMFGIAKVASARGTNSV
jgi:hypothetical protein